MYVHRVKCSHAILQEKAIQRQITVLQLILQFIRTSAASIASPTFLTNWLSIDYIKCGIFYYQQETFILRTLQKKATMNSRSTKTYRLQANHPFKV